MPGLSDNDVKIKFSTTADNKGIDDASKGVSKLSDSVDNAAAKALQLGKVFAIAGAAAVAAFSVAAVKSTAELEQSMGGSVSVFGDYAKELQKTAVASFDKMGTSTNKYLETANKMGSLFQGAGFDVKKSMEMTSNAMQRATDVATSMGISTDMALESISGAAKGNFTMMDNLGVAMNDTTLNAYALEKGIGKTTQQMTNSEKVGLAMQLFMEKTAKYAGNYAKENDTLTGSFTTLGAAWGNFLAGVEGSDKQLVDAATNVGKVLGEQIPKIAARLAESIKGVYYELRNSSPEFKKYSDIVEKTFTTAGDIIRTTVGVVKTLLPVIVGVTAAFVGYKAVVIASNAIMAIHSALIYAMGTRYLVVNGAIVAVRGAVTAATIAQAAWNAVMMLNPIGLVVGAVAALIGVVAALSFATSSETTEEQKLNLERQTSIDLANRLKDSENGLKDARYAQEGAALRVESAQNRLNEAIKTYGANSLEARQASHDLQGAQEELKQASEKVETAVKEVTTATQEQQREIDNLNEKLKNMNGKTFTYYVKGQEYVAKDYGGKNGVILAPTFSTGGFTGRGGKNDPAGIVHKGEYVLTKEEVDQSTGLPKMSTSPSAGNSPSPMASQVTNNFPNAQFYFGDASAVTQWFKETNQNTLNASKGMALNGGGW